VLVSADYGSVVAQYEYGPFAEPLRATGPLAADNPFRFSTKYTDLETGLIYYGYRYYSPSLGRWLSRDPVEWLIDNIFYKNFPISIKSEFNYTYLMTRNDLIQSYDVFGLFGKGGKGPYTNDSGHLDFINTTWCRFDFSKEDKHLGWLFHAKRHFQDWLTSSNAVQNAINLCNKDLFERAMHWLQDWYTHYSKGYRWIPFHFEYPCWGFGHFCHGSIPDHDVVAWSKANNITKIFVKKWLDHCCVQKICKNGKDITLKKCKWIKRKRGKCAPVQPKLVYPTLDQYIVSTP